MQTPDSVTVIIRSANERTEELCVHLVKEQIPADRVVMIHERPFTAALRRAYEIGLDSGSTWTLCLDADVLIRTGAIRDLVEEVSALPGHTFGGSGFVFDKLRGGRRQGGLHLYRTSLLPKALPAIPDPSTDLRPETYVKLEMKTQGYAWALVDQTSGLHDFEQYYVDIFRKTLVRSQKSSHQSQSMLRRALAHSKIDPDFLVAAWGIRVGMHLSERIDLDAKQWESEANVLLLANSLREKEGLNIEEGSILVERTYTELSLQQGDHYKQISGQRIEEPIANRFYSGICYLGWLITRVGLRIQRAGIRRIHNDLQ